jgi:prefoldin alpha subunit
MTAAKDSTDAKKTNDKASAEETLQEKYAEFRLAAAQIKQAQEQLQAIEEKKQELEEADAAISKLKEAQKGTKMLVPVTSGIFARATLDKSDEMLVNVGSNVCVNKTAEEAGEILKAKLLELTRYQESMLKELNTLTDQADKLERELGQMLQNGE